MNKKLTIKDKKFLKELEQDRINRREYREEVRQHSKEFCQGVIVEIDDVLEKLNNEGLFEKIIDNKANLPFELEYAVERLLILEKRLKEI